MYNNADWKHARSEFERSSSIDICIPKAESGLTLGKESRSVERTKKFPWKVWMLRPGNEINTRLNERPYKANLRKYH